MNSPNIYGYLRISTDKQNIEGNKLEIFEFANELKNNNKITWIEETISGSKHWRQRELGKLMDKFKPGDVFITSEISRIGRSMLQVFDFISLCSQKKVSVYCTKGNLKIDDSVQSQTLVFALSLASQIERELISSRTKAALRVKKENGVILGRPTGKLTLDPHLNEIKKLIEQGVKQKFIASKFNVSCHTLTQFIKKRDLKKKKNSNDENKVAIK